MRRYNSMKDKKHKNSVDIKFKCGILFVEREGKMENKKETFLGVKIDATLFNEFKAKCALRGITMRQAVEEMVEMQINKVEGK